MIKCHVPILRMPGISQFSRENFEEAVHALCGTKKIFCEGRWWEISASKESTPKRVAEIWRMSRETQMDEKNYEWIIFTLRVDQNEDHLDEYLEELEIVNRRSQSIVIRGYCRAILRNGLRPLFLASNIATPGVVETDKWITVVGKEVLVEEAFFHYLDFANQYIEDENTNKIEKLSLAECYDWVVKNGSLLSGASKESRFSKAINAYSHLFYDSDIGDPDSEIIWSMIGLEAIYVNSENVQKNLRDNLPMFLKIKITKKEINNLYSARSRFIHGQTDIYSRWSDDARHIMVNKKPHDLGDFQCFASYLLIVSLQEACRRELRDIRFVENIVLEEVQ